GRRRSHRPADRCQGAEPGDRGRRSVRAGARPLVPDGRRERPRLVLRDMPAPRLAGGALLVLDDDDAAPDLRRPVRPEAAALAAPLGDNVGRRRAVARRELRRTANRMKRTKPPFRADHVGSLLRPPRLLKARDDFAASTIDAAELRGIEDEAIRAVVRKQEEAGLQSATDGELRRASWHMDFIYS